MFAATRLIPLILSIVGFVGYLCLLASVILGMFGIDDGFVLYAPGALFELAFLIWLFVKGFNTSQVSVQDRRSSEMSDRTQMNMTRGTTPRRAAIVTAVSLLVMAVVAGIANFAAIEGLRVDGDPAATAANLVNSAGSFRLGAVGLLLAAVLDVIVAWGVYLTFSGVNRGLALLGGWFRLAYAAVFAAIINNLFMALSAAPCDPARMQFLLETFDNGWMLAQILFGIHLGIVGALLWPGKIFSRIVSVLLFIAGVGYFVDSLGTMLTPTYSLSLAVYVFVGEVILIIWLFVRGGREAV